MTKDLIICSGFNDILLGEQLEQEKQIEEYLEQQYGEYMEYLHEVDMEELQKMVNEK
jgi:hypothetical protein